MARRQGKPCRQKHPGVSHSLLTGYGHRANFVDPLTGKRKTESLWPLGITSKSDACRWARVKSSEIQTERGRLAASGGAGTFSRETPTQGVELYLAHFDDAEMRRATQATYASDLRQFTTWCEGSGVRCLLDLSTRHLLEFRRSVVARTRAVPASEGKRGEKRASQAPRSAATASKILRSVKAFLNWARPAKLTRLSRDDLHDTLKAVKGEKKTLTILTPREISDILKAALAHDLAARNAGKEFPHRCREFAPWLLFVLLTGCRTGEALGLGWESVHLDAIDGYGHPAPAISLKGTATKTRRPRRIDLTICPTLVTLLRRLERESRGKGAVFARGPRTAEDIKKVRKRLVEKHESREFRPQQLRQTCASYLVSAPGIFGGSAYRASAQLGHSVQVAEKYYLESLVGVPRDADTLEAALGIPDIAATIAGEDAGGAVLALQRPTGKRRDQA